MVRDTAPGRAEQPDVVGAVHDEAGAVPGGELRQRGEPAQVAVHGEHPVGDDDLARGRFRGRGLLQERVQPHGVRVRVQDAAGRAEPDAVDQRGVVGHVAEGDVAAAEQGGHGEVRLEAGGDHGGRLGAQEVRDPLLQFAVEGEGAVEGARTRAGGAVAGQRLGRGRRHPGVRGQAQVVVAARHDDVPPLDDGLPVARHVQGAVEGPDARLHHGPHEGRRRQVLAERVGGVLDFGHLPSVSLR